MPDTRDCGVRYMVRVQRFVREALSAQVKIIAGIAFESSAALWVPTA